MPCARCVVERVVKAFDADLEEQGIIAGEQAGMEWSRQPA
jgi:hypothetical protein